MSSCGLRCVRRCAAQRALEHLLDHLDSLHAQIAVIDHELKQIATREPWSDAVARRRASRDLDADRARTARRDRRLPALGIATRVMSYLGLTPSEYSSGDQQHRGHISKCGNRTRAPAAHRSGVALPPCPRRSQRANRLADRVPADVSTRAWEAQVRRHHRHRTLAQHGKRSTVTNVAVNSRTHRLRLGRDDPPAAARSEERRCLNTDTRWRWAAGGDPTEKPRRRLCDPNSRP
jgi:transposase